MHQSDVVNKIQKRRGRKKFILTDNEQGSSQETFNLSKRDQKYLHKVQSLGDQNVDLREFQDEWPKNA
jgi:hypothetical protein